ncbi:hypothetical protein E2P81_ATG03729 [Venturia nashicola]|uniref:Uncharacterized protein n=1 Tax=Venturia nashicola TaxID=86259 RepID=A0A4Z1PJJ9_9PEZI|nr:hypothetical protein E6O75_ATG03814 [Venturia nashicola]TLD38054.1 hypothetical protein E2P81_ATG03729 [Venturia nashicola]
MDDTLHSRVHGWPTAADYMDDILNYMDAFWTTWMHSGLHGCILDYMDAFWTTWMHSGLHGCILDYMDAILDYMDAIRIHMDRDTLKTSMAQQKTCHRAQQKTCNHESSRSRNLEQKVKLSATSVV